MITIAVTGGAACGKSAFCRRIAAQAPVGRVGVFSCDDEVRRLSQEPEVRETLGDLARSHGLAAPPGGGEGADRAAFRELLFENSGFRGKVEGVLHPLVLRRAMEHAAGLPGGVRIYLVEVPLLYEVDFPIPRDLDLVVAASESVQTRRLVDGRGLELAAARRVLRSQMKIEEKIKRADLVVWNDGGLPAFEAQADHLLARYETLLNP